MMVGGGQICPHHHVFAYTSLYAHIHVQFFVTFPHFPEPPFSHELKKLPNFDFNRGEYLSDYLTSDY